MVSSIQSRIGNVWRAMPTMDKVQAFARKYWPVMFLCLVGAVIVTTVVYKFQATREKPKAPSDEDVVSKVQTNDLDGLKEAITQKGNPNAKIRGIPALVIPILNAPIDREKSRKIFNCLLDAKADLNATDTKGRAVLHYAVENWRGDFYFLRQLLSRGVEVNVKDASGKSPLHYASDTEVYSLLTDHGACEDKVLKQWRERELARYSITRRQILGLAKEA